jgi:molybdopterin molybdotransferase
MAAHSNISNRGQACCGEQGHGVGIGPLSSVDEALDLLMDRARPVAETEQVPLVEALGRILSDDLCSGIDVPPADNSAVDGFALRAGDAGNDEGATLKITQRIVAGEVGTPLQAQTAARIFTGAPMPPGADTVVMQEHCRMDGERVVITQRVVPGAHVRRAGEDIRAGATVLRAGRRLRPQDIGAAASIGVSTMNVRRRIRVGILSTGNELIEPGEPAGPGRIYNSNRYTLHALLGNMGCVVVDRGIVPDGFEATRSTLAELCEEVDIVISTGGVSVGEEDHVRTALESLGRILLWGVAVKPGKPIVFGSVGKSAFLGLPGNPVALYVAFCIFARALIRATQGCSDVHIRPTVVPAGFRAPRPATRREYLRARLVGGPNGAQHAVLYDNQGSGVLTSTVWSDGLVVVPTGETVRLGDPVAYLSNADLTA